MRPGPKEQALTIPYDNLYVKEPNLELEYTPEQVRELYLCSQDIRHFIKYVKIVSLDHGKVEFAPYDYQEQLIDMCLSERYSVALMCRQSGKSTTVGAFALWYSQFHADKFIGIVSNKASSAKDILRRIKIMYEELPVWLKCGVVEYNKYSLEFDNGTKIEVSATSDSAFRGRSINCVAPNTMVCYADDHGEVFYTTIEKAANANSSKINKYDLELSVEDEFMNLKSEKRFYTVYKLENLINGKIYVGFHSTNDLDDGYLGSGKLIKRAVEKYKPENFRKEYLAVFEDRESAELLEREIVNEEFVKRDDTYNLSVGGNVCILFGEHNGFFGRKHAQETIDRIREKAKLLTHTEEAKKKIRESSLRLWQDEDFRKKQIESHTGLTRSEETKEKMSAAQRGRKVSKETRFKISKSRSEWFSNLTEEEFQCWYQRAYSTERNDKISKAQRGRKLPREHVDKINKNPEKIRKTAEKHRGMKRSEEAKKRMSEAKKGKPPGNKGKVYCYDPDTLEKKLCTLEEVPEGWLRGYIPKCKS
jgi:hypothetical protein